MLKIYKYITLSIFSIYVSILFNIAITACKNYTTQQSSTNDFPISTIDNVSSGIEETTSQPTKIFTKENYNIIKKKLDEYETILNNFIQKKSNINLKNEFNAFLYKATRFIEHVDEILQLYKTITDGFITQTLSTKKNEKVNFKTMASTFLKENDTKKVKSKCIKKPLCKSCVFKKGKLKTPGFIDENSFKIDKKMSPDKGGNRPKIDKKTFCNNKDYSSYLESIKKGLSQFNKKLKSSAENIGSTFFVIHTNTEEFKNIKEHLKIIDKKWKVVQKSNDHTELSKAHFYSMYENLSTRISFSISSTNVLAKKMIEKLKKIKNTVDEKIAGLLEIKNIKNT